jgi:cytochrome c553
LGHNQGGVCKKVGNTGSKRESCSSELIKVVVADRLASQHEAYMVEQLRLRKAGFAPSTDASAPMAPIAQRLNDDDIRAISAYFATLPPVR